jgi:hypothetical protein
MEAPTAEKEASEGLKFNYGIDICVQGGNPCNATAPGSFIQASFSY